MERRRDRAFTHAQNPGGADMTNSDTRRHNANARVTDVQQKAATGVILGPAAGVEIGPCYSVARLTA